MLHGLDADFHVPVWLLTNNQLGERNSAFVRASIGCSLRLEMLGAAGVRGGVPLRGHPRTTASGAAVVQRKDTSDSHPRNAGSSPARRNLLLVFARSIGRLDLTLCRSAVKVFVSRTVTATRRIGICRPPAYAIEPYMLTWLTSPRWA